MPRPKGREKNPIFRYLILDYYLRDRKGKYSRGDLVRLCNEWLQDYGLIGEDETISRRTIEMDLSFMGYVKEGEPHPEGTLYDIFQEEFEEKLDDEIVNGKRKRILRYKDPDFSIFERRLSGEERNLLFSLMGTLGSFDGLEGFKELERLEKTISPSNSLLPSDNLPRKVVDFGFNPLKKNSLNPLAFFHFIYEKKPCKITFKPFHANSPQKLNVSPYLIRRYDNDWFLIARPFGSGKVRAFATNWITGLEDADPKVPYYEYPGDLSKEFSSIVGVTMENEARVKDILMAAKPDRLSFIKANPFHHSFSIPDNQKELHEKYPRVEAGWIFFSITCRVNSELYTKLLSFGNHLVVLSPNEVVRTMKSKILKASALYY